MANPTFRSVSNTTYAIRTNTTITAPAGIQDGDILLACMFMGQAGGTYPSAPTAPAGFTQIDFSQIQQGATFSVLTTWYWKRASGESGNYTFTHPSTTTQGVMAAYSNCIASGSPIDNYSISSSNSSSSTFNFNSITTTVDNAMLIGWGCDWSDTFNNLTPPAGYTERLDAAPLTYICEKLLATLGASGATSMTNNSSLTTPATAMHLALKPQSLAYNFGMIYY